MPIRARVAGTKLPICASSAISAFWRRKVDLPAMLGPVISQIWPDFCAGPGERSQALAMNGCAVALQRLFDHRMPAAFDRKAERGVDLGPHIIVVDRELRQRGRDIEHGEGMRRGAQIVAGGDGHGAEPLEDLQFQLERAVAGVGDLGFDLAELGRGEADLARPASGDG